MTKKNPKTRFQKIKAEAGERRCLVSGVPCVRENLIRFVLGPDNMVYPDLAEKLDGRGVWVKVHKDALQIAVSKRLFNKGFGKAVKIPENLVQIVEDGLKKRALNSLGLANKAGLLVLGFEKILQASTKEPIAFLIEAVDGSENEKKRLQQHLSEIPVLSVLSRVDLGNQMRRQECVHIAVKKGKMTNNLQKEWMRLDAFLNKGYENE